ncbi:MAG: TIGR04086 family membrane protein [Acidimicrobiia bacterium]
MLAALDFGALILGVASGGLVASLLALLASGILTLAGIEDGAGLGLVAGILTGLAVGGWIAGARARHSSRFHGAVTGLLLAFLVVVIARLGGSPAPTPTVLWLALLSMVVGGLAGWLAGRRKASGRLK